MTRSGIILGSTWPGRDAEQIADRVLDQASKRSGAELELVDLADHPLPLDEPIPPSAGRYQNDTPSSGRRRSPGSTASSS